MKIAVFALKWQEIVSDDGCNICEIKSDVMNYIREVKLLSF